MFRNVPCSWFYRRPPWGHLGFNWRKRFKTRQEATFEMYWLLDCHPGDGGNRALMNVGFYAKNESSWFSVTRDRDDVCLTDSTQTWPALRNILDVFLSKKPCKCRATVESLYAWGKIQPCATCIKATWGGDLYLNWLPERK